MIFRMEWLTSYDAQIYCRRKRIGDNSGKRVIVRRQKQDKKILIMI